MEEKSITHQEGLDLIARMLRSTQDRFERGAGKPFILFGYLTFAVSLAVWYALKTTGDSRWNWLWFAIPVIGVVCMRFILSPRPKTVTTFIDRAVGQVWLILGVCGTSVSLYTAFSGKPFPILMVVSLLMFAGEAITGSIIKLCYIRVMGLIGIVLSFGLPFLSGLDQILGFAALFLIAMIIPGHIMNVQARRASNNSDSHV